MDFPRTRDSRSTRRVPIIRHGIDALLVTVAVMPVVTLAVHALMNAGGFSIDFASVVRGEIFWTPLLFAYLWGMFTLIGSARSNN